MQLAYKWFLLRKTWKYVLLEPLHMMYVLGFIPYQIALVTTVIAQVWEPNSELNSLCREPSNFLEWLPEVWQIHRARKMEKWYRYCMRIFYTGYVYSKWSLFHLIHTLIVFVSEGEKNCNKSSLIILVIPFVNYFSYTINNTLTINVDFATILPLFKSFNFIKLITKAYSWRYRGRVWWRWGIGRLSRHICSLPYSMRLGI